MILDCLISLLEKAGCRLRADGQVSYRGSTLSPQKACTEAVMSALMERWRERSFGGSPEEEKP